VGNEKRIQFDPFCLDVANECLSKGSQAIKLRPKAFAVLDYLLRHPEQLITKEDSSMPSGLELMLAKLFSKSLFASSAKLSVMIQSRPLH
jgi:hypothetical protein